MKVHKEYQHDTSHWVTFAHEDFGSYPLCGIKVKDVFKYTSDNHGVTCKRCLKKMRKETPYESS